MEGLLPTAANFNPNSGQFQTNKATPRPNLSRPAYQGAKSYGV